MAEMGNNIYADSVDLYIHAYYSRFCREEGAIDQYIITSPQNTWHGCMGYIYKEYISTMELQDQTGRYSIDILEGLLLLYMDLCSMYDKVVTVTGYGRLIGVYEQDVYNICSSCGYRTIYISDTVLGNVVGYDKELSTRYKVLLNTLKGGREGSTAAKLTASKGNMLGLLAVANHYHSWNAPGISYDDTRKAALDASQLPQLGADPGLATTPPLPGAVSPAGIPAGDDGSVADDWTGSNG